MFQHLFNSTVCLRKNNNTYDNIKAVISKNKITIPITGTENYNIEPGDIIERIIHGGFKEEYEVINPVFNEAFHGIPQHYQIDVRKIGVPEKSPQLISNVINGNYNKINQNSVDNSKKININPGISKQLCDILHEIENLKISEFEKNEYFELIEEIKKHLETSKINKKFVSSLLKALPDTVKIAASIAQLLPHF
jgi:hypothetical protein